MAAATLKKAEIVVTLTLTGPEARVLHALAGSVTGSSEHSPRKHADAIWTALGVAGISSYTERQLFKHDTMHFRDYPGGSDGEA